MSYGHSHRVTHDMPAPGAAAPERDGGANAEEDCDERNSGHDLLLARRSRKFCGNLRSVATRMRTTKQVQAMKWNASMKLSA